MKPKESMSPFRKLRNIAALAKREIRVYQLLIFDDRTPKLAKWLLGVAVAYLLSPIDLIPDFIPVIGHLDDVILVPVLVGVALKLIPRNLIEDCRTRALQEQGEKVHEANS